MVALVVVATTPVSMVKVALVPPPGTVTLAGTIAAVLLLDRVTVAPAAGAGPLRVTVPRDGVPSTTLDGATARPEMRHDLR